MDKLDFKKDQKELYSPGKDFRLVTVPPMQFLEADGHGNPNSSEWYGQVIEALYSVSYTLKFASKKQFARDYVVGSLEGLGGPRTCPPSPAAPRTSGHGR